MSGNAGPEAIVHIRANQSIMIDQNVDVGGIIAKGILQARDGRNLTVSTDWALLVNGGLFRIGTFTRPHQSNLTLELAGEHNPELGKLNKRVVQRQCFPEGVSYIFKSMKQLA